MGFGNLSAGAWSGLWLVGLTIGIITISISLIRSGKKGVGWLVIALIFRLILTPFRVISWGFQKIIVGCDGWFEASWSGNSPRNQEND